LKGWSPALNVVYRVELVDDTGKKVATYETSFVNCP